ncbi:MAG: SAM-dependent chlorinase/fluorinase [Gammaproteobacteria bacterium]|nr:SAM-dependent chlorinase/fluorinase [Gammaproteobacteria bacterium]
MARIITLTTDFGHKGPFVGVMKGAILKHAPDAKIIDLTHEIHVHWPAEAGFWLERSYRYFPEGSIHVAVVDPGVGTERDIVAVEYDGHVFLAPDNGLLPPAFENASALKAWRLSGEWLDAQNWPLPSNTFHGRDIFAPLAAQLSAGVIQPRDIGPSVSELIPSLLEKPYDISGELHGAVVTLDHFGNLITNIEQTALTEFSSPEVCVAGHRFELRSAYGNVHPGEFLALINSFGVVEIARAEGSAADGLGLGRGAPVVVKNKNG